MSGQLFALILRSALNAASWQRERRSAPTYPCDMLAQYRISSSVRLCGILLIILSRISLLPASFGIPIDTSLSNRPGLLRAGSREFGRFVAAIMTTRSSLPIPSRSVSIVATRRWLCSLVTVSRFGQMASISSKKMIAGARFSASWKMFESFSSASPMKRPMISGELTVRKVAFTSFAIAFASIVFPVPGGPKSKTPLVHWISNALNSSGARIGTSMASRTSFISLLSPPMSAKRMAGFFCFSPSFSIFEFSLSPTLLLLVVIRISDSHVTLNSFNSDDKVFGSRSGIAF
mmetsp:Transcript_14271/g.34796  ORF Transcript_14271/g.34796 Transcript_14271/m.34796 type:complete len:290 (-) Transcript_14271:763-1632(-)